MTLTADEKNLKSRLQKDISADIRLANVLGRSIDRIPLYEKLNTIKIDTNN